MKNYFFIFFFLCTVSINGQENNKIYSVSARSVKPPIDTSVLDKWPQVSKANISYDGNYAWYTIANQPVPRSLTLVVGAINGKWDKKFPEVSYAVFTDNSKKVFFKSQHDSLCMLTLGEADIKYIPDVMTFKLFKNVNDNEEYLLYRVKTPDRTLVLQDMSTGKKQSFNGVQDYLLHNSGEVLLLKTAAIKDSIQMRTLQWVNLKGGKIIRIWEGEEINNLVLDEKGSQLVFETEDKGNKTFWYYKFGADGVIELASDQTEGIAGNLQLESIQHFSRDGKRLFIKLKEKPCPKTKTDAVKVDVWSYRDVKLQSQQLGELQSSLLPFSLNDLFNYIAVLDIPHSHILQLQQINEDIKLLERDSMAIIMKTEGGAKEEWNWNTASRPAFFIMNTCTGKKEPLEINHPYLSPGGKYLLGSDSLIFGVANNVLSYDIATKKYHNMTRSIPPPEEEQEVFGWSTLRHRGLAVVGWLANDEALFINDQYDIWQVDPSGNKAPVNITNGYGRRHHIVFRLPYDPSRIITGHDTLIATAFNKTNKRSGFYRIILGKQADPELLNMEDVSIPFYVTPIKARDTSAWLISRQSAARSPNYFLTYDFKTFQPVSENYPEKAYNWMTSELITWKSLDETILQAALYKPENFDPDKKYPVIFHYYEKRSDDLNVYKIPRTSTDRINIAWFVSNGYIVCEPDIYYTVGQPGQSAYNAVVSAAQYLARFPWVDGKRIGIQGHSFGGYETNYIVTHTNLFSAAVSAAGASDFISAYGSVISNGSSKQFFCETHQYRLGCTIWDNRNVYIKSSPVFHADKVNTPLLMMNNKNDIMLFFQGVEFFTALRRLGKKVWMLQYDGGDHSLYPQSKEAMDYHIRMTQFFDHYLKGSPAPKWMLEGIPAKMKGIENGLELIREKNKNGKWITPGQGLLIKNQSQD